MKTKISAILAIIFILSTTITFAVQLNKKNLSLNIDGKKALAIAEKNNKSKLFINQNFKEPATRIDEVFLRYDIKTQKYNWIVQFSERACACRGKNKLNVARLTIDPNSGRVCKYEFNKGIKESDLAKKTCMKACH